MYFQDTAYNTTEDYKNIGELSFGTLIFDDNDENACAKLRKPMKRYQCSNEIF